MYATARDWARFGLFLARDGVWNGNRVLPEGFVAEMQAPNKTSNGRYSRMQTWLPGETAAKGAGTFILDGHDGQNVIIIPSSDLVVVRLGLTPRWSGYSSTRLVDAIAKAVTAP
jgi:CubicO group peptidase (beta-lactamase class C family)